MVVIVCDTIGVCVENSVDQICFSASFALFEIAEQFTKFNDPQAAYVLL